MSLQSKIVELNQAMLLTQIYHLQKKNLVIQESSKSQYQLVLKILALSQFEEFMQPFLIPFYLLNTAQQVSAIYPTCLKKGTMNVLSFT